MEEVFRMYYRLRVTKTARGFSNRQEDYRVFDRETKDFETLEEARNYLQETYGQVKRVKMYIDTKEGLSKHVGWIYCFKNSDISHVPVEKWLEQDWADVSKVKEERVLI